MEELSFISFCILILYLFENLYLFFYTHIHTHTVLFIIVRITIYRPICICNLVVRVQRARGCERASERRRTNYKRNVPIATFCRAHGVN